MQPKRRKKKNGNLFLYVIVSAFLLFFLGCVVYQWNSLQKTDQKLNSASENFQQEQKKTLAPDLFEKQTDIANKRIAIIIWNYRDSDSCAKLLHSLVLSTENNKKSNIKKSVSLFILDELFIREELGCLEIYCRTYFKKHITHKQACIPYLEQHIFHWQQSVIRDATVDVARNSVFGPSVSRHIVEGMMLSALQKNPVDFYVSVDTRIRFAAGWDQSLLKQWYRLGNRQAIVTTAPKSVELAKQSPSVRPILCVSRIDSVHKDAVVEFNPPVLVDAAAHEYIRSSIDEGKPILQTQFSEKFHFGPVEALQQIRSDPHLNCILVGLEYIRATRFWTHGYDFYAPIEDIVFMDYHKRNSMNLEIDPNYAYYNPNIPNVNPGHPQINPAFDIQEWKLIQREQDSSRRRIREIMGLPVSIENINGVTELDLYSLGKKRKLSEWVKFSNIDPIAKFDEATDKQFINCGKVDYVVQNARDFE